MLVLTIIQGPNKGRKFELPDHEPQLIGRSSEALLLDDTAISRRHAELTPDEGLWGNIRDLQSQNGTFVNGQRIHDRTRLRPGDQVCVGQTLLVFGQSETRSLDVVRLVGPQCMESTIERMLPARSPSANDESMILGASGPANGGGGTPAGHLQAHVDAHEARDAPRGHSRCAHGPGLQRVRPPVRLHHAVAERGTVSVCKPRRRERDRVETLGVFTPAVVRYREAPLDPEEAKIHVSLAPSCNTHSPRARVCDANAMTDPALREGRQCAAGPYPLGDLLTHPLPGNDVRRDLHRLVDGELHVHPGAARTPQRDRPARRTRARERGPLPTEAPE